MLESPESFKYDFDRNVKILKIGQSAGNLEFFEKALRDYTPHAQTVSAVGDEIVQTTTLEI